MPWRAATPADDEAITSRCLALYHEDPSDGPVGVENIRATLARLRAEPVRGKALALDEGGVIVGYALLLSFWSNEVGGEICILDELYVDPGHRSRGHVTGLVEALMRGDGPWPGGAALELEVSPDNSRARALYEKLGFRNIKNTMMRIRRH